MPNHLSSSWCVVHASREAIILLGNLSCQNFLILLRGRVVCSSLLFASFCRFSTNYVFNLLEQL
jgi:hypothetical protein